MNLKDFETSCIKCNGEDSLKENCNCCHGSGVNKITPKHTNDNAYVNLNLIDFLKNNNDKEFILIFEKFQFEGESPFPKKGESVFIEYISEPSDYEDRLRAPEMEAVYTGVVFVSPESGKEIYIHGDSDFFKKVSLKEDQ